MYVRMKPSLAPISCRLQSRLSSTRGWPAGARTHTLAAKYRTGDSAGDSIEVDHVHAPCRQACIRVLTI